MNPNRRNFSNFISTHHPGKERAVTSSQYVEKLEQVERSGALKQKIAYKRSSMTLPISSADMPPEYLVPLIKNVGVASTS